MHAYFGFDFHSVREFSGNYDDWYIASTLIAKQQEAERNKKLKEKERARKNSSRALALTLLKPSKPPAAKNNWIN